MKKRLLALGVATALTVSAGVANAFVVAPNGIGLYNLIPYYTAQAGSATLIHITNTDKVNGKAVKVRFRGAEWSDDVFDFTLFLSPGDVWTGSVSANGLLAAMRTIDNSCTLPADVNRDFLTFRLQSSAGMAAGTREGYIEVITMADIPPVPFAAGDASTHLYSAIKHVNGVAPCEGDVLASGITNVLSGLQPDQGADTGPAGGSANVAQGMVVPSSNPVTGAGGSLMSFAININVPSGKAFLNEAKALNVDQALDGTLDQLNRKIFFRQANEALAYSDQLTADRIFETVGANLGTGLQMFQFDMPDLTTVVSGGYADAFEQRDGVTAALARPNAVVEYVTDDAILATTDVVFNQPTRRFYYTYDNTCSGGVVPDDCIYTINNAGFDIDGEVGSVYASLDGENNLIEVGVPDFWDREEDQAVTGTDIVISPNPPITFPDFFLVGEVAVLSLNNNTIPTGSLNATLTAFNYDNISTTAGPDGWVDLSTTGANGALPVIGFTAIKLFNGGVGASGTNYGVTLPLRTPQ